MLGLTYFKRFRMEIDLSRDLSPPEVPLGYRLVPWRIDLLAAHAEAKYQSFRNGIDSQVFACLGEHEGCLRLMREISQKEGFLPGATWLASTDAFDQPVEYCGTIQGIRDRMGLGAIQNLGTTPDHRARGIGSRPDAGQPGWLSRSRAASRIPGGHGPERKRHPALSAHRLFQGAHRV